MEGSSNYIKLELEFIGSIHEQMYLKWHSNSNKEQLQKEFFAPSKLFI